jgi:hypothetical protein
MTASAITLLILCVGCVMGHRGAADPHIDTVRPDSVMLAPGAVVEVVVHGHGFTPGAPGRNTIQFGDATITNVPASTDGTEIRLMIPDRVPLRGEAAPLPLEAGRYNLRVQTTSGTSNSVSVRVDR